MGNFMSYIAQGSEVEDLEEPVAYMGQDWKMLGFPAEAILIIMEHLTDQADASRCMRATRKLIAPGEKIVLKYPVQITQENLESFCMFIRKDVTRGRFLRDVSFDFTAIESRDVQTLIETMRHAKNLKKLTVMAPILEADWRVAVALQELTSVEELIVKGHNAEMHRFLLNMHCPVRKVHIEYKNPGESGPPTEDMLNSLSRFHSTLEELTADHVTWLPISKRPASKFPKLRMLHLGNHTIRNSAVLEEALPGLRILKDGNYLKLGGQPEMIYDRVPWAPLALLHVHPGSTLVRTLCGHVDVLCYDIRDMQDFKGNVYNNLLHLVQPHQLILKMRRADTEYRNVGQVLSYTPSTRIRTLAVAWKTVNPWGTFSWVNYVRSVQSGIKDLELNITRLVIKTYIYSTAEAVRCGLTTPSYQSSSQMAANGVVVPSPLTFTYTEKQVLYKFASMLPRLEYITCIVETEDDVEQLTFRVVRRDSGREKLEETRDLYALEGL